MYNESLVLYDKLGKHLMRPVDYLKSNEQGYFHRMISEGVAEQAEDREFEEQRIVQDAEVYHYQMAEFLGLTPEEIDDNNYRQQPR